jgi:hypothetical protein
MARPRAVLGWTILFGVLAGLLAAGYHSIASEPAIDEAIAIEEEMAAADEGHHHDEDEQVSRETQSGVGLFGGYALIGAALGLLLAVTTMALRGSWLTPLHRFLISGTILAGAVHVAPWFKYPPNPPAVGDENTVGNRTFNYLLLILLTGIVLAGAAHLSSRLRNAGWDNAARTAAVAAVGVVGIAVVMIALPANSTEIPAEVPASLVWRFRTAALIGDLLLWGALTIAAGFAFSPSPATAPAAATDPSDAPASASSNPQTA